MNIKTKINIRILIVILAATGILIIQIRWLHKAYKLNHIQETQSITLALEKTSNQLINLQNHAVNDSLLTKRKQQHLKKMLRPALIDSLIRQNLIVFNIDKAYNFTIYDSSNDNVIVQSSRTIELTNEARFQTAFSCFSNSSQPYILELDIETTPFYAYKNLFIWSIVTLAFILIILLSFMRTIVFLRKEKTLTREKMDFVNNMIHEFKTPLATIQTVVQMLTNSNKNAKDVRLTKYLRIISDENYRLQQLVEKLMGMTVIDRAELALSKEKTDLHQLIEQALKTLTIQFEQYNARVETNLVAKRSMVYVDTVHIVHIITNILENSLKYNNKQPHIYINTDNEDEKWINLEICDNGTGIPYDQQKLIFNQFYRGSQHKKSGKSGFGLGLYYVKKMVAQHNGKIFIESVPEQGTCFSVYFEMI